MSYFRRVISGADRGVGATVFRALASAAEPAYASAILLRNRLYDRQTLRSFPLGRPTISVGNLTAGGTGKTPFVQWLAARLRAQGLRVAILARGYKAKPGTMGDEQIMLDRLLNHPGQPRIQLIANPDRIAAAAAALTQDPAIDVFILDDAFQHRRARRDRDIVLINAAEPFGFGRLLPRGLLREPLRALVRAHAVLLTHVDQADASQLEQIEQTIRKHRRDLPIFRSSHAHLGLVDPFQEAVAEPIETLADKPFFAFAGIGDPASFHRQLERYADTYRGQFWFPDHHQYSNDDLQDLQASARAMGARFLVTTEKDAFKLVPLDRSSLTIPVRYVRMELQFSPGDDDRLFDLVRAALPPSRAAQGSPARPLNR